LETLDLRSELAQLQIPVKCLLGDRDQLVPITLVESLSELNKTISIDRIAGAGHAPFISQPHLCADKINEFFND